MAISGDTAIVGAPRHDGNKGKDSGSVYVFVNIGRRWKEQATFTASDVSAGDQLGTSVAISRDTVIVGAPGNADAGRESGAAYSFVRSGEKWKQQAKLTARDAAKRDKFGTSVAIHRNTVIVGALFWLGALTIFFVMFEMINVVLIQPRDFRSQVVRVRLNLFSELTHVGMERLRIGI